MTNHELCYTIVYREAKMKTKIISFRVTPDEKKKIEETAKRLQFKNASLFILFLWDKFKRENQNERYNG